MAFRQPTLAPASRPTTAHAPERNDTATVTSPYHLDLQESHEWIFPPRSISQTQTASTEYTPKTAGLSRLSDFGSLVARSRKDDGIACEATDGSVGDDEELESLDEGLHAFQEPTLFQRAEYLDQGASILPRHDGLGTFPASTPPVQEQLWHFEQYNPRKRSVSGHQRRRSSVQRKLDAIENNDAEVIEGERRERIEKWRLDQSRILLDEIEKETRQRRRASSVGKQAGYVPDATGQIRTHKQSINTRSEDQDTQEPGEVKEPESGDDQSLWQRITRRVIRDFIGIDDATLSVIFGETLPEERSTATNPSAGPGARKSIRLDNPNVPTTSSSWEGRLLTRIARELDILVQQLSDQPGAFSTPLNPSTSDYAGMPVTVPTSSKTQPKPSTTTTRPDISPLSLEFNPTLQDPPLTSPNSTADSRHAALWGIEEEPATDPQQEDERDYWEQPPDLKTVFRFLHNRFTTQRRPSTTSKPPLNVATTSTPDSLRRAAIIRQYHPVVSRAAAAWEHRHGHARRHSLLRGRSGSSCASSLVGSARRLGLRGGSLGSSSRNYWDIGGSTVGSGGGASAINVGGLGAWGEV